MNRLHRLQLTTLFDFWGHSVERPFSYIMSSLLSNTLVATGISYGSSAFMIIGGVIPYVPQYMAISSSGSVGGFSTQVCLVLLLANFLRIAFWFGHPFELPLLLQSIIMIVAMVVLLQLCISVTSSNATIKRRFLDFDAAFFWKWTSFDDYLQFLAAVACVVGVLTASLRHNYVFVEVLGLAALMTEACLAAPQFWHNYQSKSTEGMSISMVLLWLTGDVFKTLYFIVKQTPLQFWLCGFIQVSIDIAILVQVGMYRL